MNKFIVIAVIGLAASTVAGQANGLMKNVTTGFEGAVEAPNTVGALAPVPKNLKVIRQMSIGNDLTLTVLSPVVIPPFTAPNWNTVVVPEVMGLFDGGSLTTLQNAVPLKPEYLAAPSSGPNGFRTTFPVRIVGENGKTFSLAQLRATIDENTTQKYINEIITYTSSGYSAQARGKNWGPDNIRGTADDLTITSGSSDQLVHEFEFIGAAAAYLVNDEATLQLVKEHMASYNPFEVSVTYDVLQNSTVVGTKSGVATTTAPAAPQLAIAPSIGGRTVISIVNGGNRHYTLEKSSTMAPGSWEIVGPISQSLSYPAEPNGNMSFFRAR